MKLSMFAMPLLAAAICTPATAGLIKISELSKELQKYASLSNTYMSGGDGNTIFGNVLAKTYASSGNGSTINGDFRSGDVATLGRGAGASGDVESVGTANVGALGGVGGNVVSGGVGTVGLGGGVSGNFTSGGESSLETNVVLGGEWQVGAKELEEDQKLDLALQKYKANPDNEYKLAAVGSDENFIEEVKKKIKQDVLNTTLMLIELKAELNALPGGILLKPTMVLNTRLQAGVYMAPSWSTTAGTILELDGQNKDNQIWVFNIQDILAFGGVSNVKIVNQGNNAQVFWNVGGMPGGYLSIGDGAKVVGMMMADTYIMVGANAIVSNVSENSCAGLYSSTSYVSVGASAIIGGEGCSQVQVPEPATYPMLLAGFGLMGFITRRRYKKAA